MAIKTFLSGFFGAMGSRSTAAPTSIAPKSILFTVPTLSDDISPQEPAGVISPHDLVIHDDDWRQLEFYPHNRLEEVQHALTELKSFEATNRAQHGWRNVYVRRIKPAPLSKSGETPDQLGKALHLTRGLAPVLFTGTKSVTGRIANGFTLQLGSNAWLYGVYDGVAMVVLGAELQGADDSLLTRAFTTLSRKDHLILVDWRRQMLLIDVDADGRITVWRP